MPGGSQNKQRPHPVFCTVMRALHWKNTNKSSFHNHAIIRSLFFIPRSRFHFLRNNLKDTRLAFSAEMCYTERKTEVYPYV